jgi:hypothetical protein
MAGKVKFLHQDLIFLIQSVSPRFILLPRLD